MNAHGLRCPEIIRMTERRDPGNRAIHVSENSAPSRSSVVAAEAILSFRRKERDVFFCSPVTVTADGDAAISIVRQEKRAVAGGLLRRNDIERGVRLWTGLGGIGVDGPDLVQYIDGFRCAQ